MPCQLIARDTVSVKIINQLDTGMSRHDIVVMSSVSPSAIASKPQKLFRNLKAITEDDLIVDACLLPWDIVVS